MRCTAGVEEGQVECYEFNRFWCMTGMVLDGDWSTIGEGQEAIDYLMAKHLGTKVQEVAPPMPTIPTVIQSSLAKRAVEYSREWESAAQGERNSTAFRNAGHLFAMVDDDGRTLSDQEVFEIMSFWNQGNIPPIDATELEKVVASARSNGTPRVLKPPTQLLAAPSQDAIDSATAMLNGHSNGLVAEQPTLPVEEGEWINDYSIMAPLDPGPFPVSKIPTTGIIGEFMDHARKRAFYSQPILDAAAAISLVSVITGRRVQDETRMRTNVFVIGIAPTGAGKDTGRDINKDLLPAADADFLLGEEEFGSAPAITSAMDASLACLFQCDEIGGLIAATKNPKAVHMQQIPNTLKKLYTSAHSTWKSAAYADREKVKHINQPHLVLYGNCTAEAFWENITAESVTGGFLGRTMVFESAGRVMAGNPTEFVVPEELVEMVKNWTNFHPGGDLAWQNPKPQVITYHADAKERLDEHRHSIDRKMQSEEERFAGLWSRTAERTKKLSMIFACSDQIPPTIEVSADHMDRAVKISNWLTRRAVYQINEFVAGSIFEEEKLRCLRLLSVQSMTLRDFTRKTQFIRDRKTRLGHIADWQDAGMVVVEEKMTGQRPTTFIRRTLKAEKWIAAGEIEARKESGDKPKIASKLMAD
jgi:hypothetical protein